MAKLTNLPMDLLEELLSRIPVTSLRRVRSACKQWNTKFREGFFTKKHLAQQAAAIREGDFLMIVLMDCSLYLMHVNLHNNSDPSITHTGKLISPDDSYQLDMSRLCHCDGLLLCTSVDYTRLVVWNPYTGQTRWISVQHMNPIRLRAAHGGVWYAQDKEAVAGFLICFDFTTERYLPPIPLPFECYCEDTVILSSVRQEQLAVLFQKMDTYEMEIWVTTKIEPDALSWTKFLAVGMDPLTGDQFCCRGSFLIDKEKKAVVVFDEDYRTKRNTAYIVGQNDYFKQVDLEQRATNREIFIHAVSYVPTSAQINILA